MSTTSAPSSAQRRIEIETRLRSMLGEIAGLDLGTVDAHSSFIALGLDSLTLTLAATQIKRAFGVAPTFRQLMETHRNFDALATFLNDAMPAAEMAAQAATAAERRPAAAPALDMSHPPRPDARLGRGTDGRPAWFVPNPEVPGKYVLLQPAG